MKHIGQQLFVNNLAFAALLLGLAFFSLALFVPGPIQRESYMGAEYCGSCHSADYQQWVLSPHAKAFHHLPDDKKTDLGCLSCHATGVFDSSDKIFRGVQCESCHGPGQYYAAVHIKKDPVLSKLLFMQKPETENCLHCHAIDKNLLSPALINPHALKEKTQ